MIFSLNQEQILTVAQPLLADLFKKNRFVTLYDVTLAVRNQVGLDINVSHDAVKAALEPYFNFAVSAGWLLEQMQPHLNYSNPPRGYCINDNANVINTSGIVKHLAAVPVPVVFKEFSTPVDSSFIMEIGWSGDINAKGGILSVTINNDDDLDRDEDEIVDYEDVPYAIYKEFIEADSKGKFYNQKVKGKFANSLF